jgi:hypothetical protein
MIPCFLGQQSIKQVFQLHLGIAVFDVMFWAFWIASQDFE